ncbi:helix-turn-helix domain-containing protein [Sphingomonas sp. DG1-23]|uniref:helix-turn-helix domain-containing protein n=1 Tax=Sphingomonas sp. DG1-23 TaxID=3068316 RepID=UPI00273D8DA4|nr:helix-turn-helix domain-containing protein [Sphingomonas sp. DG1-23]MDP5279220.1 helix-turn-helix domain-containing protein [Sphingomonas sp. DG1-23]
MVAAVLRQPCLPHGALHRRCPAAFGAFDRTRRGSPASACRAPEPREDRSGAGLADALGLTSVYINRTLQAMRRDGAVTPRSGNVVLSDPERLAISVDCRPTRVTSR